MSNPFSLGFVGGLAGGVVTSTFGDLLTAPRRAIHQSLNRKFPNEIPDTGSIIKAWQKGILSERMLSWAVRANGVVLPKPNNPLYDSHYELWQACSDASLTVPSAETIVHANVMGLLSDDDASNLIKRSGSEVLPYNILRPYYYSWMDESKLFLAYNRDLITELDFQTGLKRLGLDHGRIPEYYNKLRENIPQTGDILRYAALGLFDDNFSSTNGLYNDKPEGMEKLFNANGFHGVNAGIPNTKLDIGGRTWSDIAWAGHWSTLGVGVVGEMMRRFRADRVNRYGADGLNVNEFTTQDARAWMKRNAIPPLMIDSIIASGYRPLDRRVLMVGFQTGEIQDTEAKEILRDSGLNNADSDRFVDILHARVDYANQAPIRAIEHNAIARTFQVAKQAYEVGTIDRTEFIGTLTNIGVSADAAETHAHAIDGELQNRRFASILKALKRDYLNGTMDPFELSSIMSQSGVAIERQQQYLTEWGALRTLERRTAQTEKILSWYVQGILTQDVAYARLKNLGWVDVDALAHIAEASLRIAKRESALEQAGYRTAKANAAQIDRLRRQALSQAHSLETELRRLTPVGRLIKWYRQGSISAEYFENRLRSMGYPDDKIALYLEEANKDGPLPATAKRKQSVASVPVGNAGTGTSAGQSGTAAGQSQPTA